MRKPGFPNRPAPNRLLPNPNPHCRNRHTNQPNPHPPPQTPTPTKHQPTIAPATRPLTPHTSITDNLTIRTPATGPLKSPTSSQGPFQLHDPPPLHTAPPLPTPTDRPHEQHAPHNPADPTHQRANPRVEPQTNKRRTPRPRRRPNKPQILLNYLPLVLSPIPPLRPHPDLPHLNPSPPTRPHK
ncbi:hypothetical protein FHU30_004166 [Actinomadura rupiterrae]|nr:hypothetical protein [Actinomadura rupiterrae]